MFKKIIFIVLLAAFHQSLFGQIFEDPLQVIKEKTKTRIEQKAEEAIDESLDAVENGMNEEETVENDEDYSIGENNLQAKSGDLQTYSKFDFIPGEEVIFYDDFSDVSIGDFPLKWNTTAAGEIVTLNNVPGKWLTLVEEFSCYSPEIGITYPDNFTIEFDIVYPGNTDWLMEFYVNDTDYLNNGYNPGDGGYSIATLGDDIIVGNYSNIDDGYMREAGKGVIPAVNPREVVRYSVWVQGQRLRVYVKEKKVIDIPRAIPKDLGANYFRISSQEKALISNFRLAVGAPDTRSRLLTEGKFVTRGITFDSGSDVIKPESYGVLKEIADVLKENGSMRIQIIGHTDSDGADDMNLTLSQKRSAAVKIALGKQFAIDGGRIETDGKGESQPVSSNSTTEGKANNRRVEFIKLT